MWRIEELSSLAERALEASSYQGPPSARVREVPDVRTIRYYTTAGLIDRPAEMRGRTAYYGRRHLLQLVAIKRLQEQGLPLVEVQERLALPAGVSARANPKSSTGRVDVFVRLLTDHGAEASALRTFRSAWGLLRRTSSSARWANRRRPSRRFAYERIMIDPTK